MYWNTTMLIHVHFYMAAFVTQQNQIVVTAITGPTEVKTFTIWSFMKRLPISILPCALSSSFQIIYSIETIMCTHQKTGIKTIILALLLIMNTENNSNIYQ